MSSKSSTVTVASSTNSLRNTRKAVFSQFITSTLSMVGDASSYKLAVDWPKSMAYPSKELVQFITTKAYVSPASTGRSALNGGPFKFPGPFELPVPPLAVEMPVAPLGSGGATPYELQPTSGDSNCEPMPSHPPEVMSNRPQS